MFYMLIAREKRRSNIAEYILYMWQVEDTIRAFEFDTGRLYRELISNFEQSPDILQEIREWYENIAAHMVNEKAERSGHIQTVKNVVNEMHDLHMHLLQQPGESEYADLYAEVKHVLEGIRKGHAENDVESCLNIVYIYMMMRLQNKKVSEETEEGIKLFIRFLAMLSVKFKAYEEGEQSV
jgi:hypothetical protein